MRGRITAPPFLLELPSIPALHLPRPALATRERGEKKGYKTALKNIGRRTRPYGRVGAG